MDEKGDDVDDMDAPSMEAAEEPAEKPEPVKDELEEDPALQKAEERLEELKKARSTHLTALDLLYEYMDPRIDQMRFIRELLWAEAQNVECSIEVNLDYFIDALAPMLIDLTQSYDKAIDEIKALGDADKKEGL